MIQEEEKEDQDRAIEERLSLLIGRSVKRSGQEERAKMDVVEEGDVDMPSVKSEEPAIMEATKTGMTKKTWLHVESGEERDTLG